MPREPIPTVDASSRRLDQAMSVERGYDRDEAMREAGRCLDCGVNTVFDSEKCIMCAGCVDVCPEMCLELVSADRLAADDEVQALLGERCGGVDPAEVSVIIKDEERCIRCSLCADRCPTGAITMERFTFDCAWRTTLEGA